MGVSVSGRAPPCEKASSSHWLEMTSSVTGFVAFYRVFSEGLSHLRGDLGAQSGCFRSFLALTFPFLPKQVGLGLSGHFFLLGFPLNHSIGLMTSGLVPTLCIDSLSGNNCSFLSELWSTLVCYPVSPGNGLSFRNLSLLDCPL